MVLGVTDLMITDSTTRLPLNYSGIYSWPSDAGAATTLRGRIRLPVGASLTGGQVFTSNANAFSVNCNIWVYARAYNAAGAWTETVINGGAAPTTLDAGTGLWTTLTMGGAPYTVIDDTFVEVLFILAAVDLVYIHGFRFTYTMTNLDAMT
jgi:hypothetical protein